MSRSVSIVLLRKPLNNVFKHARAENVDLSLQSHPDGLELSISDDGSGFDQSQVSSRQLGLKIMHERSQEINALLEIDSKPGGGTEVVVYWKARKDSKK